MLIAEGLIKVLTFTVSVFDRTGNLPFRWDKNNEKLVEKSTISLKIYTFRMLLTILYLFLAVLQIYWTWGEANLLVMSHTAMFTIDFFMNVVTQVCTFSYRKDIIKLLNAMVTYEQHRNPMCLVVSSQLKIWITKGLMLIFAATGVCLPVLFQLDVLRNPCYPINVGYRWAKQCKHQLGEAPPDAPTHIPDLDEWLVKIGITLFSLMNWSFSLFGNCFHFAVAMVMVGHCFRSYLFLYGRCV